ncbi:MAG: aminotransferase class I/II-fold pyridoxal phosphate-dependent enzyme [Microscillaceae bacterium]|nr:aminotransferase class I/II-fold pyridoxal phosphate-dependent enzyme [Microscillaceae bacterium]
MKNFVNLVDTLITEGVDSGLLQLSSEDDFINGKTVKINRKDLINFGSCSYLGLEVDERMKYAAMDAVNRFGTQFSASRSYVSIGLYEKLEALLSQIFQQPTLAVPTTSLGHISALPTIIDESDVVIKDLQVHASVQNALTMLRGQGVYVKTILHNRIDQLADEIEMLKGKHRHIWYMADGVYSMYGDTLPIREVADLLNQYEQFHLYVDDAHGMSWTGMNGSGFVLNAMEFHPRMVMATSLNKGFASGGGALVFPNELLRKKVRNCGASLMFSGPMQPSSLGAAICSANIHLSPEIKDLQADFHAKMRFFEEKAEQYDLRLINHEFTPIFFIGVGKLDVGFNLFKRMKNAGYFMNLGMYPAVSRDKTGIRVALNRRLSFEDIDGMLAVMAQELEAALKEENSSKDEILSAFGLPNKKNLETEIN